MFEHCCVSEYTINYFGISVLLSITQPGIQTSRHRPSTFILLLPGLIYSNAVFDAKLTYHSWPCSPTYLDIWFQVRLNLWPLWHSVCDVHSGNRVPLWSWLAVKTSSLFNSIFPQDITLHPLTLDIRTLQRIFRNCCGVKTRYCCRSLFAKFLRNSLECFTWRSSPPLDDVMYHQSVVFQKLFLLK